MNSNINKLNKIGVTIHNDAIDNIIKIVEESKNITLDELSELIKSMKIYDKVNTISNIVKPKRVVKDINKCTRLKKDGTKCSANRSNSVSCWTHMTAEEKCLHDELKIIKLEENNKIKANIKMMNSKAYLKQLEDLQNE